MDRSLDWLIVVSILVIGGSAGLFFFLPAAHRISGMLGIGGGAVLALSLLLKTTLWLIPWVAGGLFVCGAAFAVYEVWRKYRAPAAN